MTSPDAGSGDWASVSEEGLERQIGFNRKAIIETTGEELSTYADVFKKALDEGCICVVGNEETYTKLEGYTKLKTI